MLIWIGEWKNPPKNLLEEFGTTEADSDFEAMNTSGNLIAKDNLQRY